MRPCMDLASMRDLADIGPIAQQQVEVAARERFATPRVAAGGDPSLGKDSPLGEIGLELPDTSQLQIAPEDKSDRVCLRLVHDQPLIRDIVAGRWVATHPHA